MKNLRDKKITEIIKKAENQTFLNGLDFSILMQNLLISEDGYVIYTGNWENVNNVASLMLFQRIKRHPILWKLFFMVG